MLKIAAANAVELHVFSRRNVIVALFSVAVNGVNSRYSAISAVVVSQKIVRYLIEYTQFICFRSKILVLVIRDSSMSSDSQRFTGTDHYVATEDLKLAVNAALTLQRPLLIKGEPGTGKTMLAEEVAQALDRPLLSWHIKSTTKAHQGLYEYDAVSRLRDSQLGDEKVHDIRNYIVKGQLWHAFESEVPAVVLIDEIDKADIEFPNDLLQELDRMEFDVYETRQTIKATHRPLIIITSNNEKDLPDAFLRRCFFHYINFPDPETMQAIVAVHFPTIRQDILSAALQTFFALREAPGLKKKPSTSEFLDWLQLLLAEGVDANAIKKVDDGLPLMAGALLKNEQDLTLLQRLADMARAGRRY